MQPRRVSPLIGLIGLIALALNGAVLAGDEVSPPPNLVTAAAAPARDYAADLELALTEIEAKCGHFLELKKIDWKGVSNRFREEVRKVRSDEDHLVLLVRLLARLEDGHAAVLPLEAGKGIKWPGDDGSRHTGPGMFWCRSEDRILVKNSWAGAAKAGIRPGMEIVAVDGVPAAKWIERRSETIADRMSFSTEQQRFFYTCHWGLADAKGTRLQLTLKDLKGRKRRGTLVYTEASVVPEGPAFLPEKLATEKDLKFGRTAGGWGYIHIRRCPDSLPQLIDQALKALADPPGLILDFRGNSGGGFDHDAFFGRFVPKGKTLRFAKRYESAGPSPYAGPVVVIVDATVRSAGETAAGIFKEDGRAYLIGESPTAGMSSSKTKIRLPSGLFELYVSVSSNKLRFNDGKGIEGIGVIPHETVSFRPEDLAAGVDTLIARAEALLVEFPQSKVPYDPADFGWKRPEKRR